MGESVGTREEEKRLGLLRGKEGETVDGEERGKDGKWEGEELQEKRDWVGRR
jgi:hypothetical protein